MPITLPESDTTLQKLVIVLRQYLRDYAELNRLITGQESGDRFLAFALLDALDDFNNTPPITRYDLTNFPSVSLLIRGAAISVIESVGILATRNQLSFSDGGVAMHISDKAPLMLSWLQMFSNKYEEKKVQLKKAINIEKAWGPGVGSEYAFINWIYGGV